MGAGYENLPATKMLDLHCGICGLPLVAPDSAEWLVGPDCRKKYGIDVEVPEEAKQEAKEIIHKIAFSQQRPDPTLNLSEACERLAKLGFPRVGARIAERFCDVLIQKDADGRLVVRSPYSDEMVQEFRQIPGRFCRLQEGRKKAKENVFPYEQKKAVWAALKRLYPLRKALLPDGSVVVIADEETRARIAAGDAKYQEARQQQPSGFGDVGY